MVVLNTALRYRLRKGERMAAPNYRIIDGLKFMWDGKAYGSKTEAESVESGYKKDGFETKLFAEGPQFLVYTRRVVKEVKVEGAPA